MKKADALQLALKMFQHVGVPADFISRYPFELSGGMRQRAAIAMALVTMPSLIILDEPFSGLDPVNANLIKDEIYGLAQRGSTVIFSTHRMEQVEEICNHIVLMNLGKKILDGTVSDVKQQFKENKFSIKLHQLPVQITHDSFELIDQKANALTVKIKDGYRSNDVLQFFLQQNVTVEGFNEILPSLNDIFIQLVEGTKSVSRAFQQVQS